MENNKLSMSIKCGFRRFHSTTDHLVRFGTYVRKGYAGGKHVTAVFFDLEKAYDSAWRYGFKVRVASTYSSEKMQNTGVSQRSMLSVTLFALKINEIPSVISYDIFASLFVDDILIAGAHEKHDLLEGKLQITVNAIIKWAGNNGFRFSVKKTKLMQFYSKTAPMHKTSVILRERSIPHTATAKFLGLNWDSKLN